MSTVVSSKKDQNESLPPKKPWRAVTEVLLGDVPALLFRVFMHVSKSLWLATRHGIWDPIQDRFFSSEIFSKREELYEEGLRMLRNALKSVTVVSTIRKEKPPSRSSQSVQNQSIREYFVGLHGMAYKNMLRGAGHQKNKKMTRYTDLQDPDKWHEAFSLLYYGADVEIKGSELPIEFLTVDNRSVLVGFPSKENELLSGMKLRGIRNCEAILDWVASHGSAPIPIATPTQLAQYVRGLMAEHSLQSGDDCLLKVVDMLGDTPAAESCANKFDKATEWYEELYQADDEEDRTKFYLSLDKQLRLLLRLTEDRKKNQEYKQKYSFLDIGCGPAFGAMQLIKRDVDYHGVDISSKMVRLARSNGIQNVYHCDAIGALLEDDNDNPECRNFRRRAVKKFNVIACQGNTFDLFLGEPQKALALFLFDRYLEDQGILLFTAYKFSKDEKRVLRKHKRFPLYYDLTWYGRYICIDIMINNKKDDAVIHDPCSLDWLEPFLDDLGYNKLGDEYTELKGPRPSGGKPYSVWIFQKRPKER